MRQNVSKTVAWAWQEIRKSTLSFLGGGGGGLGGLFPLFLVVLVGGSQMPLNGQASIKHFRESCLSEPEVCKPEEPLARNNECKVAGLIPINREHWSLFSVLTIMMKLIFMCLFSLGVYLACTCVRCFMPEKLYGTFTSEIQPSTGQYLKKLSLSDLKNFYFFKVEKLLQFKEHSRKLKDIFATSTAAKKRRSEIKAK